MTYQAASMPGVEAESWNKNSLLVVLVELLGIS